LPDLLLLEMNLVEGVGWESYRLTAGKVEVEENEAWWCAEKLNPPA
jgi:hypothetical protein